MNKVFIHKNSQKIFAVIIFVFMIAGWAYAFVSSPVERPYIWVAVALSAAILLLLILDFKIRGFWGILLTLLVPVTAFYTLEAYTHLAFTMKWQIQVLNIFIYALIYVFMIFIIGRISGASIIFLLLVMLIGLINYYTVQFRSSPILPWDLLSIKTALSVTKEYTFKIPNQVLMVSLIFIFAMVLMSKVQIKVFGIGKRVLVSLISAILLVSMTMLLQIKAVGDYLELDDILFTPNVLYRNNGFMAAFAVNLQYLKIHMPEGYDTKVLERYADEYSDESQTNISNIRPNIIVIMDEAFSDLSAVTDFETNEDYMPFIHHLMQGAENTVSGNLFVSVCGGNTANSEYEFLTGNSMSFLPEGSVAYQQYIHEDTPSLAWQLKAQGYDTYGIHPYYSSGWDRDEVYPFFGFDETRFKEQMQGSDTIRQYISDAAAFDMIKERYEQKGDRPLFTFEVTMQNHGGYFKDFDNFDREIELVGVKEGNYRTITERYLSLIKKTDTAFEDLVAYFESYHEPTIIVMFGDHQPGDYVLKSIYQFEEQPSIENMQKRYTVPFVMWANFDIEEDHVDAISMNYLSTLLLQKVGLPLSPYQHFLKDLNAQLPVINAKGAIDSQGNYYSWDEEVPDEQKLLPLYKCMQYNLLFDKKEKVGPLFAFDLIP